MKKSNFTDSELLNIIKTLSPRFNVRINKAGNITVSYIDEKIRNMYQLATEFMGFMGKSTYHCKEIRGYWTLYACNDGKFLWRRHDGTGNCYPLNMRGRKFEGKVTKHRNVETGRIEYWGYKPYNIDNSYFNTFEDALNYFVKYLKKYKNISI